MKEKIQFKSIMRHLNGWLILAAVVFAFTMTQCSSGGNQAKETNAVNPVAPVNPALLQKQWTDMTAAEKQTVLEAIIKSNQDPYKTQRQALEGKIMDLYRQQMELPATLEFEDPQGKWVKQAEFIGQSQIKSVDEGTLGTSGKYRANNTTGQKVPGTYSFTFKFDGKALTVIDSSVK